MKKYFFLLCFTFLFSGITLLAQVDYEETDSTSTANKTKSPIKDRLYFGGNLSINFGTFTVIGGTPIVGYRITDSFSAGVGATYFYFKQDGFPQESFYGGNVFLRQVLFDVVFLQSEFHLMNVRAYNPGSGYEFGERITIPQLYLGGGFRQSLGGNIYGTFNILFDVIDHPESRFSNPMFGGGLIVGF